MMNGDVVQVVHTGPFQVLVVQPEAQAANQVQIGAGACAKPRNIPGVLRNARLYQNNGDPGIIL
jgi:hypothetical protein